MKLRFLENVETTSGYCLFTGRKLGPGWNNFNYGSGIWHFYQDLMAEVAQRGSLFTVEDYEEMVKRLWEPRRGDSWKKAANNLIREGKVMVVV